MTTYTSLDNITLEPYTEKSFVLRGDTRPHKDDIKALGGKWNSNLRDGPGWIFPKDKESIVSQWLHTGQKVLDIDNKQSSSSDHKLIVECNRKLDILIDLVQKLVCQTDSENDNDESTHKRLL